VTLEAEGLPRVEVEDLDVLVGRATCKELPLEVYADDAVGVALECRDALASVPVPDLDGVYPKVSNTVLDGWAGVTYCLSCR
jgi:hypothetical protein